MPKPDAGDDPTIRVALFGVPRVVRGEREVALTVRKTLALVVYLAIEGPVTQAEDWPVLSGEKLSFELKPSNFFDRNPALDLRRAPFEVRR